MRDVRDAIAQILDNTTLAQVCERIDEAKASATESEGLMFYI
jgi:DNA-binding IscR family transcriptional regulator